MILCLARSSAPSPWQASQSGDGNTHTITVSASWGVSSMSRSSGQVPDKRVGTGDVSGLQGGLRKPPFFHTPTLTTSSITVDTTIAQQVLSSMGRRRKKHICPPAPNTYEPEQDENPNPSRLAPSSSSPVVLPCHHHNRLPLLLLADQYDTTISRRDIVNLSLPPFPSTAPTRPQPPPSPSSSSEAVDIFRNQADRKNPPPLPSPVPFRPVLLTTTTERGSSTPAAAPSTTPHRDPSRVRAK